MQKLRRTIQSRRQCLACGAFKVKGPDAYAPGPWGALTRGKGAQRTLILGGESTFRQQHSLGEIIRASSNCAARNRPRYAQTASASRVIASGSPRKYFLSASSNTPSPKSQLRLEVSFPAARAKSVIDERNFMLSG